MTLLAICRRKIHSGVMTSPCPICHKPATASAAPFCSDRCRTLDLNRWFTGGYSVPAVELDDVDMDALDDAERAEKPDDF